MTQRFLDNWQAATVAPLTAVDNGVIEDLAPTDRLDQITAVLTRDEFFLELTLVTETGGAETAREIVRVFGDGTLQRAVNSEQQAWPAGTKVSARYTAAAANAAADASRHIVRIEADLLVLDNRQSSWLWQPESGECSLQVPSPLANSHIPYRNDIQLDSGAAPQVVNIHAPGGWAFRLPDGATVTQAESGPYVLTLPGDTLYRLRLRGSTAAVTVDISDYNEYTYP